jgi:hypothetical protein
MISGGDCSLCLVLPHAVKEGRAADIVGQVRERQAEPPIAAAL